MANVKISQLAGLNPVDSTTVFLTSSNYTGTLTSYKATIGNLATAVLSNVGSNSNVLINQNGNVSITSNGAYTWAFDINGNLKLPANSFSINYANGSQASAPLVDILNTNGLTTVFYPTFVENRSNGQIVRADVDLTYRTDTNTLTVENLSITGGISVTGNLTAANIYANSGTIGASLLTGTLTTNAQPNITSVGTLTSLSVTGNIGAGNVSGTLLTGTLTTNAQPNITSVGTLTSLSVTGNVGAGNVSGTLLTGTLTSNAQPNITSVGTLTSLSVTGNVGAGNVNSNVNGFAIGYRDVPQVSASNTTLTATDAGKHYYSTTAGNLTLTIPNNATTAFSTGTAISIVVQAAGNILVNAASGVTLYMAGNSTSGNRVVGTYGMATLLKVASDTWFINGTGVS